MRRLESTRQAHFLNDIAKFTTCQTIHSYIYAAASRVSLMWVVIASENKEALNFGRNRVFLFFFVPSCWYWRRYPTSTNVKYMLSFVI